MTNSGDVKEGGRRTRGQRKASLEGEPLVSIVTVVRNGEADIERTISSVVSQSYSNIEYIVIDGLSEDGTLAALSARDAQIDYWVSEEDAGLYDAMNKGIGLAGGDIVGLINCGDWYDQDVIRKVVDAFQASNADVVFGNLTLVDAETGIARLHRSEIERLPETMLAIGHPATFVRRSIYAANPFDLSFRIAADHNLFLTLYLAKHRFHHLDASVASMQTGGLSSSLATAIEVFKIRRRHISYWAALRQLLSSIIHHYYFAARRAVLELILPRAVFATVRHWWILRRSRGAKDPLRPRERP